MMQSNADAHSADDDGESQSRTGKAGKLESIKRFALRLIYSKHMLWGVGVASFLEAIIVPIPLETILIPLMHARRKEIFVISTIALLGCILAATVGYFIGYFVFDAIGAQLVSLVSTQEQFEQVSQKMHDEGFWFVFSVGVIPIPFQIAMLAAGATKYSFLLFVLASTLSRALRYYGLAVLVLFAGDKAQRLFEKHKMAVSIAFFVVVGAIWASSIFG